MRLRAPILLLVVSWLAMPASFDCRTATTPQEKTICSAPELSELDEQVAAAYDAIREQLSPVAAGEVEEDQRDWLLWLRQICRYQSGSGRSIGVCLKNQYTDRLKTLRGGLQKVDGMTFFPRLKVLTAPDTRPPSPRSVDPGFGVGRFEWPEINQPKTVEAQWNLAVRAKVVSMSQIDSTSNTDFKASSVADSEVYVFYKLKAANGRLVSVELENSNYNYGAAHPNEDTISFQWWLEAGRQVAASDIFRPDSGWEAFLQQRCYQNLISGEHASDLYPSNEVRAGIADNIKDVEGWMINALRFEIEFPEYSVAPRAAGRISVAVDWDELKPYFAKGFKPEELPPRL